jgi:hypothetical protein
LLTLHVSVMTWPLVVAVGEALMLTTGVGTVIASVEVVVLVLVDESLPPPQAASTRHSRAPAS